jgi:UDP-N-acetylmuramate dehydrogenase
MIPPKVANELRITFAGRVKMNESLRNWTTFRCSAPAAAIVMPQGPEELIQMVRLFSSNHLKWGKEWGVIGRGSNLLIRDGGFPGILIDLTEGFSRIAKTDEKPEETRVRVEGGVSNGTLLQWTREKMLSGFEWAYGIPGTVGGGVRMNAGTPLGWFAQITRSVEGIDTTGRSVAFTVKPDDFRYRDFPLGHDLIITAAQFVFRTGAPEEIDAGIEAARAKRKGQPLELPNFGSVFKNPPGDYAGRLIEAAGLKGLRIGEAEISSQHANFIVNLGRAKTSDVMALMERAKEEVRKRFSIDLEAEVHLIGVES